MEIHCWPIEELVVFPLVLDVLLDGVLIDANCANEVPSRPERFFADASSLLGKCVVGLNGALSLEESHDVGNRIFWWNGDEEVQMIGCSSAFQNLCFFAGCKFPEHFADLDPDLSEEDFLPVFWYDDHVVFTVPYHVTLCFEGAHSKRG